MKQKIFLKKPSPSSRGPNLPSSFVHFRTVFRLGIILLLWVAIIPLLWHQKNKTSDRKFASEKNMVVKAIPKSSSSPSDYAGAPAVPGSMMENHFAYQRAPLPAPDASQEGATEGQASLPDQPTVSASPSPTAENQPAAGQPPRGNVELELASPPVVKRTVTNPVPIPPAVSTPEANRVAADREPEQPAKPQMIPVPQESRPASPPTVKPAAVASVKNVAPQPLVAPRPEKPVESRSLVNWLYIVRLGAFQNAENAQDLQRRLQAKGYPVVMKSHYNLQMGKFYRVEVKPMANESDAKDILSRLQREEQVDALLLKVAGER